MCLFSNIVFRSMKLHNICKKSGGGLTQVFLLGLKWILKTRINAFRACEFQLFFFCLFIPVKWTDRFLFEKQGISGILFKPHAVICFQCPLTLCSVNTVIHTCRSTYLAHLVTFVNTGQWGFCLEK